MPLARHRISALSLVLALCGPQALSASPGGNEPRTGRTRGAQNVSPPVRSGVIGPAAPRRKPNPSPQAPLQQPDRHGTAGRSPQNAVPAVHTAVPVTILARAESIVQGPTFTVGEVADLSGEDKELIRQLASVEIGASPLPGLSRPLFEGDILVYIRGRRLSEKRFRIVAPPAIRITRAGQDVPTRLLTEAALRSAESAIRSIPGARIEPGGPIPDIVAPTGTLGVVPGAVQGRPETGALSVPVKVGVDGAGVRTVEVPIRVIPPVPVVVAKRTVEARTLLAEDDLEIVKLPADSVPRDRLATLMEAVGKRALRRIAPHEPLAAAQLELPPLFAANERITIEFVSGPLRLTAPGITRQPGRAGETVRVYAPDTRRELEATVIDAHTVRLALP